MWCAKCQAQFASSRENDVPQCPRCAGPLVEEVPLPDAVQQAQELLQRWDDEESADEESADEELEAAKVGFTDAELGL